MMCKTKLKVKIIALMVTLFPIVSCGKKKTQVFIPNGAYLLGKKVSSSKDKFKIHFQYIWHQDGSLKIKTCPNQVKSRFDWDSYRIMGFIKKFSCGTDHPVDAVLVDREGNEGIAPSDESIMLFKTKHSFYLSSDEVDRHLIKNANSDLIKLIEKYEEDENE